MPEEPSPSTPNPEPHFSQLTLHLTTPMPLSAPVRPDQVADEHKHEQGEHEMGLGLIRATASLTSSLASWSYDVGVR